MVGEKLKSDYFLQTHGSSFKRRTAERRFTDWMNWPSLRLESGLDGFDVVGPPHLESGQTGCIGSSLRLGSGVDGFDAVAPAAGKLLTGALSAGSHTGARGDSTGPAQHYLVRWRATQKN